MLARPMWPIVSLSAALLPALSRAASPFPALGVTRDFSRQTVAPTLSLDEVRRLMRGGRRLQDAGGEKDPVEQVHLMAGADGGVVVVFVTERRGFRSSVLFGTSPGSLCGRAAGKVRTYAQYMCPTSSELIDPGMGETWLSGQALEDLAARVNTSTFSPRDSVQYFLLESAADVWDTRYEGCLNGRNPRAYWVSKYIHTVPLSGLRPNTTYFYRPEAGARQFTFTTPAAAGDASRTLRLGVTGDLGVTNVSRAVMDELLASNLDLLLIAGDYSYADGLPDRWDAFGVLAEPLMSAVPHISVPGNHEISSGREQGTNWEKRYPVPYNSDSPLWYSYEVGLVHVVCLVGSYAPTEAGSPQHEFLREDLAAVNRLRTPWLVVMFHTPWYNSNSAHYLEGWTAQQDLEDMFYQHGVDLVLNGHVHSYERSHPVYRYAVDECGATHVVIGDGGNFQGPAAGWRQPQPAWSAFREASFGAGVLEVHNGTHATWQWRRAACATATGTMASGEGIFFAWNGDGSPDGPACATSGDGSEQAYEASDEVTITRDAEACPNRAGARRLWTVGADLVV